MSRIDVTKTFLPPKEEYEQYLSRIWESGQITNQGPILREFEAAMLERLKLDNFHFVTNGTIALQLAFRALDILEGEIITTPFSYVATTSSILWERCTPVFVDIEPNTYGINPALIEAAITPKTKAILAVHVFGYPCDVVAIQRIADKHNLKVIYDAAHAFGVEYGGKSLLDYGDVSICSFHATKLFHTIEGGCLVAGTPEISDSIELIKRFGHNGDDHFRLGINAKASEFQAAMGMCNLKYVDTLIEKRKSITDLYDAELGSAIERPKPKESFTYNYAYYPAVFASEKQTLEVLARLADKNIYPRRYFFPSLNELPYLEVVQDCPVSEDISRRILCLPLFDSLDSKTINTISKAIKG